MFDKLNVLARLAKELPTGSTKIFIVSILLVGLLSILLLTLTDFTELYKFESQTQSEVIDVKKEYDNMQKEINILNNNLQDCQQNSDDLQKTIDTLESLANNKTK